MSGILPEHVKTIDGSVAVDDMTLEIDGNVMYDSVFPGIWLT